MFRLPSPQPSPAGRGGLNLAPLPVKREEGCISASEPLLPGEDEVTGPTFCGGTQVRSLYGIGDYALHPGSFQWSQVQRARPMISSLSRSDSQGSSSVNIVTHCRQEQGIRVMSVPQNMRSGPKAS